MHCSRDFNFREIEENSQYSHVYKIDEAVYRAMIAVFQDQSPIHVDEAYARSAGFAGKVMHGAILQGFLSHFVGMRFPGRRSMLLSANLNYRRPSYLGDELLLTAVVRQKVETGRVIVMDVRFTNRMSGIMVASGRIQTAVRDE